MSKRIIAINRMYGSNGRRIGKALSEELGIHCYDKDLIRIASEKEGLPYEELVKVDEKRASGWRYPLDEPAQMAPQYRLYPMNDVLFQAESEIIRTILRECFEEQYVSVVTGGRAENTCLLNEHFDYIFFTGSQAVGKEVMKHAAEHLTPVTLELGGKSPCIVDKNANIRLAAKRIVFGKYLNCGQTCVAPDYIYCDRAVKDRLVKEIRRQIQKQFGKTPLHNFDYGKIINEKHFDRICGLIDSGKVVCGGKVNRGTLQIEPTVMDNVTFADRVMQEEIFGPLMPILTYDSLEEAIRNINSMPHPLALYIFTNDNGIARKVISQCGFGGGCINDTIIHLATSEMGFGGFGPSGMGSGL